MRRRLLLVALVTGLTVLATWGQLAGAQTVERIQIADAARQQHGLPAELVVELSSPADYDRQSVSGDSGRWTGPRYEEPGNPANSGFASLDWRVRFDEREGDAEAVTFANFLHPSWELDQRGDFSVPHRIGTRVVGTLLGYFVIRTPAGDDDARFEGVIAFPLDKNLHAVAHFEALDPRTTRSWSRGRAPARHGTGARFCSPWRASACRATCRRKSSRSARMSVDGF